MVFVGLPPGTAELVVTTIYVFVVIITLPAIRGGEGGHSSHGRKSDRDDKKRFHGSFSRLRWGSETGSGILDHPIEIERDGFHTVATKINAMAGPCPHARAAA